jgi:hypothetical protein
VQIVDQREYLLRRGFDAQRTLDTERIGLSRGQRENGGNPDHQHNHDDDSNCLDH